MKRAIRVLALACLPLSIAAATGINPKLASVRKAFIEPVDELGDDKGIAVCFADHLHSLTPIEAVKTKEEADVVFKVSAHLPSATTRYMVGIMGGSPSAHLFAELPDGTKLWDDGAKLRRSINGKGATTGDVSNPVACGLADELLDTLREAMKKARDMNK